MDALKTVFFVGIFSFCALGAQPIVAADSAQKIRVNRYTLADAEPTESQSDLMSAVIDVTFSPDIKTVGEAMIHLLRVHGFTLAHTNVDDDSQYVLYLLPLPEAHRQLGPLRLNTALRVLAGVGFELQVNAVTRQVHFRLREAYGTSLSRAVASKAKKTWDARVRVHLEDGCPSEKAEYRQSTQTPRHYGPVVIGDDLSHIALTIKPQQASMAQTMMGLYDLNPFAFSGGTIHMLQLGAVLQLPAPDAILAVDPLDATTRVTQHDARWLSLKKIIEQAQ